METMSITISSPACYKGRNFNVVGLYPSPFDAAGRDMGIPCAGIYLSLGDTGRFELYKSIPIASVNVSAFRAAIAEVADFINGQSKTISVEEYVAVTSHLEKLLQA